MTLAEETRPSHKTQKITNFEQLVDYFHQENFNYQINEENQFVALQPTVAGETTDLIIRWAPSESLVHFVERFPLEIPADRMSDVETAMHRINHVIAFPGLGIRHDVSTPYFRVPVPTLDGSLSVAQLLNFLGFTMEKSEDLFPGIKNVVEGKIQGNRIEEYFQTS